MRVLSGERLSREVFPTQNPPPAKLPSHRIPILILTTKVCFVSLPEGGWVPFRLHGEPTLIRCCLVDDAQVSEGSPAATAGLEIGDLVLRFGGVDISHPKGLGGVVDVVREKEGQQVPVTVLRGGGEGGSNGVKNLTLVPKTWDGRGLLGVHLLPP